MVKNTDVTKAKPEAATVQTAASAPDDFVSQQDFAAIKELRTKNAFIAARAEKAILESRLSEVEYKNAILNIYVKYGLTVKDSIDETTGKILRNTEVAKENNENS